MKKSLGYLIRNESKKQNLSLKQPSINYLKFKSFQTQLPSNTEQIDYQQEDTAAMQKSTKKQHTQIGQKRPNSNQDKSKIKSKLTILSENKKHRYKQSFLSQRKQRQTVTLKPKQNISSDKKIKNIKTERQDRNLSLKQKRSEFIANIIKRSYTNNSKKLQIFVRQSRGSQISSQKKRSIDSLTDSDHSNTTKQIKYIKEVIFQSNLLNPEKIPQFITRQKRMIQHQKVLEKINKDKQKYINKEALNALYREINKSKLKTKQKAPQQLGINRISMPIRSSRDQRLQQNLKQKHAINKNAKEGQLKSSKSFKAHHKSFDCLKGSKNTKGHKKRQDKDIDQSEDFCFEPWRIQNYYGSSKIFQ